MPVAIYAMHRNSCDLILKQQAVHTEQHFERELHFKGILHLRLRLCLHLLHDLSCKEVVHTMTGTVRDDVPLDEPAHESQISKHIQQLVACRLVGKSERLVHHITHLIDTFPLDSHDIGQTVYFLLINQLIVDHDGVIQVASLDQSVF